MERPVVSVSIVVPVYDEEENLPELIKAIEAVLASGGRAYEIICVDDGSRDRSFPVLKELAATRPHLRVIRFARNFGQTAALNAGFSAARHEVVIPLDADLQNDPADIPVLLEEIGKGADVVSGWRKDRSDALLRRKMPSRIANGIISRMTQVRLHDYGCTLKAYRREVLAQVRLYGEMHRFIPAYAAWNGARVTEIPVRHHPRRHGASKYGLFRTFKVVLDLLFLIFWTKYLQRPMHFFGGLGLMSFALGATSGLYAVYIKVAQGRDFVTTPLPLMTLFFLGMGVQFMMLGLLAEILVRIYHESLDKPPYLIRERIDGPAA